jgi:hypothetical protein
MGQADPQAPRVRHQGRPRACHQAGMRLLRWAVVEAIQRHPPTQPPVYTLGGWLGAGSRLPRRSPTPDPEVRNETRGDGYVVYRGNARRHDRAPTYRMARQAVRLPCLLAGPRCSSTGDVIARGLCRTTMKASAVVADWTGGRGSGQYRCGRNSARSASSGTSTPRKGTCTDPLPSGSRSRRGSSGSGRGSGRAAGEFSVVHERLARDVHELLLGLGIKVTFGLAPAVRGGARSVSGTGWVSRRACRCSGCRGRPGGLPRCACGGRCSGT